MEVVFIFKFVYVTVSSFLNDVPPAVIEIETTLPEAVFETRIASSPCNLVPV